MKFLQVEKPETARHLDLRKNLCGMLCSRSAPAFRKRPPHPADRSHPPRDPHPTLRSALELAHSSCRVPSAHRVMLEISLAN